MVEKLDKPVPDITTKDFINEGLWGVCRYYDGSSFKALKDAGYDLEEGEMKYVPQGYWGKRENRVKAIKRLVEKLDKPVQYITSEDFLKYKLGQVLQYSGSSFKALKDAGYDIKEWEMSRTPRGYWEKKENRSKVIRKLVERLGKPITEIYGKDFIDFGLGGMVNWYYSGSPFLALIDAGYDVTRIEMKHRTGGLKYTSGHGHLFRSMAERDLDDIFWSYKLTGHEHNVEYPKSKLNCDFVFGGKYWVEYAGLLGKIKSSGKNYDEKIEKKKRIAEENNLDLTIITQTDFYSGRYLRKVNHIVSELGSFNQDLEDFI